jgi:hypothetical protein
MFKIFHQILYKCLNIKKICEILVKNYLNLPEAIFEKNFDKCQDLLSGKKLFS